MNELVDLTGWHRDHARTALREALVIKPAQPRRPRPRVYGDELLPALVRCWVLLRAPTGKIPTPFMPVLAPLLRTKSEITVTDTVLDELLAQISTATIDRMLADQRSRMRLRGRARTKPGSLLKHQISIRTFTNWDDAAPGFVEIDLVTHDGGVATGKYCLYTLTMTDIATGWTINRSQARKWAVEAIDHATGQYPVPDQGYRLRQWQRVHQPPPCCVLSLMEAERISASIKLKTQQPLSPTRLGWQPIAQLVPVGQRRERRQR